MSGDAANEIPSTLPRWGTLMRSFLRDGQLLGRAVAEQARALMHRWKAIFQGKMDVVRPVHIKQLGPPPEQPRGTLLRSLRQTTTRSVRSLCFSGIVCFRKAVNF